MGKQVLAGPKVYENIKLGDEIINTTGDIISGDAVVLNHAIIRPDASGFEFTAENTITGKAIKWYFSKAEAQAIAKYFTKKAGKKSSSVKSSKKS